MLICEQCGREHDGTFGSGRFCCRSCSNKWVALHQSDEAKSRKVEIGKKNLTRAGKGWNLTKEQNIEYSRRGARARAVTMKLRRKEWLNKVFLGEVNPYNGGYSKLKSRLIEFGYKEARCESCGLTEWLGSPIALELHHEDGDRDHNNLDNLKLLCPNCHSMTENYKWRKFNRSRNSK